MSTCRKSLWGAGFCDFSLITTENMLMINYGFKYRLLLESDNLLLIKRRMLYSVLFDFFD